MDNSAPASVEFDIKLTPSDYAAVTLLVANTPVAKRQRIRVYFIALALIPVVAVLVAATLWALDPDRVPFADAIGFLPGALAENLPVPMGVAAIVLAILSLTYKRNVNVAVRRMAGGNDDLIEAQHLRLDAQGVHITRPYVTALYEWPGLQPLAETDTHFFLRVHKLAAIVMPKRDIGEDKFEAVRAIAVSAGKSDAQA